MFSCCLSVDNFSLVSARNPDRCDISCSPAAVHLQNPWTQQTWIVMWQMEVPEVICGTILFT